MAAVRSSFPLKALRRWSMLEDLAADPQFTGRVLIGIAPQVFFQGFKYRGGAVAYTRKESPSQRIGQWLSMHLIEPYFAFDDSDYALETVLERQPWPAAPRQALGLGGAQARRSRERPQHSPVEQGGDRPEVPGTGAQHLAAGFPALGGSAAGRS